jgi:hypothetical protein
LFFISTEAKEMYMKIDAYTKTILTIIALGLMWLCVRDTPLLSHAQAQAPVQEVKIVGISLGREPAMLPVSLQEILVKDPYDPQFRSSVRWVPIGGTVRCEKTP